MSQFQQPPAAVGVPDELERLWAPYRMAYIRGEDRSERADPNACPFCVAPASDDVAGLVVARGEKVFALLNLYPYNPGHLLVCPYRHVADLTDLEDDEATELLRFTQIGMRTIRAVSGAQGFNLGMNQGTAGGAGIAPHLHQHLVPRWVGDANFIPVIGKTKVLPQLLGDTRALLAKSWPDHS